jgi:hypothetical protein
MKSKNGKQLVKALELITKAQKLIVEATELAAPSGIGFSDEIRIIRKFGVDKKKDAGFLTLLESLKACDEKEAQFLARRAQCESGSRS